MLKNKVLFKCSLIKTIVVTMLRNSDQIDIVLILNLIIKLTVPKVKILNLDLQWWKCHMNIIVTMTTNGLVFMQSLIQI